MTDQGPIVSQSDKQMILYVYRRVGRGIDGRWDFVSEHRDIDEAERAATALCGNSEIYTEPGMGLPRAFFGKASSLFWSAMISPEKLP